MSFDQFEIDVQCSFLSRALPSQSTQNISFLFRQSFQFGKREGARFLGWATVPQITSGTGASRPLFSSENTTHTEDYIVLQSPLTMMSSPDIVGARKSGQRQSIRGPSPTEVI